MVEGLLEEEAGLALRQRRADLGEVKPPSEARPANLDTWTAVSRVGADNCCRSLMPLEYRLTQPTLGAFGVALAGNAYDA